MQKTLTSLLTFALTLTFITSSLAYAKPGREYYTSKSDPAYENSVKHKTKNDIIIIGTAETENGTERTTEKVTFESTTAEVTTEETTTTTTSETTKITTEETTTTTETTTEETTEKTTETTTEETTETTTLSENTTKETTTESESAEDDEYKGGNGGNYADIDDELNIEIHDSDIGTLNINKTTNNTINQTTKEGDTYVTVINEAAPEPETTEPSLSQDTYNIYMDNSVTYNNMPQYISLSIGSSNMSVDGNSKYLDVSPYIQASTSSTMLPLRGIAEAIPGAQVDWDAGTKTALVSYNNKSIYFPINTAYYIDTEEGIIPNANNAVTEINSSRTFLPLRTITQAFGFDVDWDGTTKTVTLLS